MPKAANLVWSDHADFATVFPDKLDGQDAFKDAIVRLADKLECPPAYLLAVMEFESGLSATAVNQWTGAYGLIQFTPIGLTSIGVSMADIKDMNAVQQMEQVEAYFAANGIGPGASPTLSDLYMSILWPPAVGEPEDSILYSAGNYFYETNKVLDTNFDGHTTKAECAAMVSKELAKFVGPTKKAPAEPDAPNAADPDDGPHCTISFAFEDSTAAAPKADSFDFVTAALLEADGVDLLATMQASPVAAADDAAPAEAIDVAQLLLLALADEFAF